MRAIVQRVGSAKVMVGDRCTGEIGRGLLVFVGIEHGDGQADIEYIASKVRQMRVFEDEAGKMNRSVEDVAGSLLIVSQFTLCGDCRKGRRPSFDAAAPPDVARGVYEELLEGLRTSNLTIATGEFQAEMQVQLVNDGPVTIMLDSRKRW